MKRILIIIIALFLIPIIVNAETITYNICKNGCEYDDFDSVISDYNNIPNNDQSKLDIVINFSDSEEYSANSFSMYDESSITVNGNNATLNTNSLSFSGCDYIEFNDLTINTGSVNFFGKSNLNNFEVYHTYNKDNKYVLNNVNIDAQIVTLVEGTHIYNNSTIREQLLMGSLFDLEFNNSTIDVTFFIGQNGASPGWDTNIYIYSTNTLTHDIYRIEYSSSTQSIVQNINLQSYMDKDNRRLTAFLAYVMDENMKNYINENFDNPINENTNMNNSIFYYQDIDKTIKETTSIKDFESEFKNTYKNAIGYAAVKNKPIEWKSENESIATLDNGTIKPIANGQVDLVGTRGDDIYTIHLIVDMPVKKTNEKKGRMAPSTKITLKSLFKDIDISTIDDDVWEISDPSVAKIVNGEIISLAKGETDIVATINGVKYVYHLTVSDTLVSKETKVPITGKSIKLWIVVVGILLLSVIGMCIFLLIKKK